MTGSWAGAMGQPQFMPSSYLQYAVDFDGDGRRDIWRSSADALASILTWQDWEEMFALAKFVGVSRPGYELSGKHLEKAPKDTIALVTVSFLHVTGGEGDGRMAETLIEYPDPVVAQLEL